MTNDEHAATFDVNVAGSLRPMSAQSVGGLLYKQVGRSAGGAAIFHLRACLGSVDEPDSRAPFSHALVLARSDSDADSFRLSKVRQVSTSVIY